MLNKISELSFKSPVNAEGKAPGSQKQQEDLIEVLRMLLHKLTQPLTALRGSLEVALMGESLADECRRVIRQSLEESDRVVKALEMLREVLEAEDPGEDSCPVSWGDLVGQALEEAAPVAREKELQMVFEPMPDVYVKVNPHRAGAAIRELLRQAIRRSRKKEALRIGFSAQRRWASISVWNDAASPEETGQTAESPPAASFVTAMEKALPDWWVLKRTVRSQGGWFEIEKTSPAGVCYRLHLPLASTEAARHSPA